jgi:hypothetical protein
MVSLLTLKANSDASLRNLLALMADLQGSVTKATRGTTKSAVQAQLGDSWETIANRSLGGPDGGRAMRLINTVRHGAPPQAGKTYIVPKKV